MEHPYISREGDKGQLSWPPIEHSTLSVVIKQM